MLANEEAIESEFVALEGASEGGTIVDTQGIYETAQEQECTEEEAPTPAKEIGLRAKSLGLKKGDLSKKSASEFGVKDGGLATDLGHREGGPGLQQSKGIVPEVPAGIAEKRIAQ